MLAHLTKRVTDRTSVLNRFLTLCDACDEAVVYPEGATQQELVARPAHGYNLREEKVFRHCATITQLYGIYEAFTEASLAFWLTRLPRYQLFPNLPQAFRNAYRCGIARVIQDSEKRRYRHVELDDVLGKYLASLRGESPWELVGDALTAHDSNLRRSEFEQLLHSAGLDGVWSSLERNPSVARLTTEGDANKTLEQMILDLVTFRNDAAHGTPDEILGVDTLRDWVAFVKAFCDGLAEFLTHRIVHEEAEHKPETVCGIVTETFRHNVSIAKCDHGTLHVGDYFYFMRATDSTYARIDSLQVKGVSCESVIIEHQGFEVGIQTSVRVPIKAKLVRVD